MKTNSAKNKIEELLEHYSKQPWDDSFGVMKDLILVLATEIDKINAKISN